MPYDGNNCLISAQCYCNNSAEVYAANHVFKVIRQFQKISEYII
jgi:hypothetical protein